MNPILNKKQKMTEHVLENNGWKLKYHDKRHYIMNKVGTDMHRIIFVDGSTENLSLTEVEEIKNQE